MGEESKDNPVCGWLKGEPVPNHRGVLVETRDSGTLYECRDPRDCGYKVLESTGEVSLVGERCKMYCRYGVPESAHGAGVIIPDYNIRRAG